MNKNIVMCGCSFSHHNDEVHTTYGEIIARKLDMPFINLSELGASNYFIAKQIEHSINFLPKLVIIGATTPMRFETVENCEELKSSPSINNFKYRSNKNFNQENFQKIISKPLMWYEKNNLKIFNFYSKYYDYEIKKNQDKFILLGALSLLAINNINFIVVDFSDILSDVNTKFLIISENFKILNNLYPHPDKIHFNQMGHDYLAKKILTLKNFNNVLQTS